MLQMMAQFQQVPMLKVNLPELYIGELQSQFLEIIDISVKVMRLCSEP
jgi:hypothetical protein